MIYITQGHEDSIALEVFLKSIPHFSPDDCQQFTLIANRQHLIENCEALTLSFDLKNDGFILIEDLKIAIIYVESSSRPASCSTLEKALELINPSCDILLTLPTSKDQLPINKQFAAGYTEYFRKYFRDSSITMSFRSSKDSIVLMSDHIPISQVSEFLTTEILLKKLRYSLNGMQKYFEPLDEIIIAGINPHAGEGGILGSEDIRIVEALKTLCAEFPTLKFYGPLSADTLHTMRRGDLKQLFVYMYHDQGLPVFKDRNGFEGVNISFGMPFLRMSVDHGTAFELSRNNCADFTGCLYMLREAIRIQAHL